MLTWTQERPHTPGWYWMLSPGVWSNLPTIVQVVWDRDHPSLARAHSGVALPEDGGYADGY
jgi:hypothetical protein